MCVRDGRPFIDLHQTMKLQRRLLNLGRRQMRFLPRRPMSRYTPRKEALAFSPPQQGGA